MNANRMPRHTAAGRPEANGGQVGFGGSAKSKQSQSNRFTAWLVERGSTQSLVSFEACTYEPGKPYVLQGTDEIERPKGFAGDQKNKSTACREILKN